MSSTPSCYWIIAAVLIAVPQSHGQNVNPGHPEEIQVQKHLSSEEMRDRLANSQLQKDSNDLSELAASIKPDLDGLNHGILSKDVIDKLKRMEKLSKRLREQLSRVSGTP